MIKLRIVEDRHDDEYKAAQHEQMSDVVRNLLTDKKIDSERRSIKSLYDRLIRDGEVTDDKVKCASKIAKILSNLASKIYFNIDWKTHLPGLYYELEKSFKNDLYYCEELIEDLNGVDYDEVVYTYGEEVKKSDWLLGKIIDTFDEIFKYLESIGYTIR